MLRLGAEQHVRTGFVGGTTLTGKACVTPKQQNLYMYVPSKYQFDLFLTGKIARFDLFLSGKFLQIDLFLTEKIRQIDLFLTGNSRRLGSF